LQIAPTVNDLRAFGVIVLAVGNPLYDGQTFLNVLVVVCEVANLHGDVIESINLCLIIIHEGGRERDEGLGDAVQGIPANSRID
jgi:hypothetical protein